MNDFSIFEVGHRFEDLSSEMIQFLADQSMIRFEEDLLMFAQVVQERAVLHVIGDQTQLLFIAEEGNANDSSQIRMSQFRHDVCLVQQFVDTRIDLIDRTTIEISFVRMQTFQGDVARSFV